MTPVEGAPAFTIKPENISFEEGQTIKLTCQVKGRKSHASTHFIFFTSFNAVTFYQNCFELYFVSKSLRIVLRHVICTLQYIIGRVRLPPLSLCHRDHKHKAYSYALYHYLLCSTLIQWFFSIELNAFNSFVKNHFIVIV